MIAQVLVVVIDLEKDCSPLGFECAKVVFFVWIVGVTEVIKDGYCLNDAFDCLLAECSDTGCHNCKSAEQVLT